MYSVIVELSEVPGNNDHYSQPRQGKGKMGFYNLPSCACEHDVCRRTLYTFHKQALL